MAHKRSCEACGEPDLVWGRTDQKKPNGDWVYKYFNAITCVEAGAEGANYTLPGARNHDVKSYIHHEAAHGGFVPDYWAGPHICDWSGKPKDDALHIRSLKGISMNVRAKDLKDLIVTMYKADVMLMIEGRPGCGKTDVVKWAAKELGIDCFDPHAATMDTVDQRGIPAIKDGATTWCVPSSFPKEGKGLYFIDELPLCPQSVQNGFLQLMHGRKLGDAMLPKGWLPIAAGNRVQDRANAKPLPTTIRGRVCTVTFEAHIDDWADWAIPAGIDPMLVAGLKWKPSLLMAPEDGKEENSQPSPRKWEYVDRLLKQNAPKKIEFMGIEGLVGTGAATEIYAFFELFRKLPNLDHIILSPEKAVVPGDPATRFATAVGLANKITKENFGQVVKYLARLPQEFNVLAVKTATSRDESLAHTSTFTEWGTKYGSSLA